MICADGSRPLKTICFFVAGLAQTSVGDCERSLSVLPTLNADSCVISAFFFAFLGLKCPFLTQFLPFFPFSVKNDADFNPLDYKGNAISIIIEKRNRRNERFLLFARF